MSQVIPRDEEIKLENNRYLVSETDTKGIIPQENKNEKIRFLFLKS